MKFKQWGYHANDIKPVNQITLNNEDQQPQKTNENLYGWPKSGLWTIKSFDGDVIII